MVIIHCGANMCINGIMNLFMGINVNDGMPNNHREKLVILNGGCRNGFMNITYNIRIYRLIFSHQSRTIPWDN